MKNSIGITQDTDLFDLSTNSEANLLANTSSTVVTPIIGNLVAVPIIPANKIWHQDTPGVEGVAESFDNFGSSLGVGDFDGDGYGDLVVGVPFEDVLFNGSNKFNAGAVNLLYGSFSGLTTTGNNIWHQGLSGIADEPEGVASEFNYADNFGTSLGIGDFNGDGKDDLAVGVPGENISFNGVAHARAGAVNVLYGSNTGLTASGNQFWHQNSQQGGVHIEGGSEVFDQFGSSLAAGDFNGDGKDDLAVGVPGENISFEGVNNSSAGAVNVLYGSNAGLTAAGNQMWHQNVQQNGVHIGGGSETNDQFGSSLAVGDFDGDGKDDLAVGVSGESVAFNGVDKSSAGAVNVLYGSNGGLTATGNQIWDQNSQHNGIHIEGGSEENDKFGSSLATGDFNGDGKDDLAIGVPGEVLNNLLNAGAVNVLYGSNNGLAAANNEIWHQNSSGVEGVAESGEYFGSSLAVGDFNGDGFDDLAIGTPYDRIDGKIAGSVNVLYGSSQGLVSNGTLTIPNDQIWHQNTNGVEGVTEDFDFFGQSLGAADYNKDGYADLAIGVPGEDIDNTITNAGAFNIIFGSAKGLVA